MQEYSRYRPLGVKYSVELWLPLAASFPAEMKGSGDFRPRWCGTSAKLFAVLNASNLR